MKKVTEYKLVVDDTANDFNRQINDYIKAGWEVYGTPFPSEHCMCQAVVKYEDNSGGPDAVFI